MLCSANRQTCDGATHRRTHNNVFASSDLPSPRHISALPVPGRSRDDDGPHHSRSRRRRVLPDRHRGIPQRTASFGRRRDLRIAARDGPLTADRRDGDLYAVRRNQPARRARASRCNRREHHARQGHCTSSGAGLGGAFRLHRCGDQERSGHVEKACAIARSEGFAKPGDHIAVSAGMPFGVVDSTNLLHIAKA